MTTHIQADTYSITYDATTRLIILKGILRLNGLQEYAPVAELLMSASITPEPLTVDLRSLEFLNSSGIAMLSLFVIDARNRNLSHLTMLGSQTISWQGKSLKNLQRLMPNLTLDIL